MVRGSHTHTNSTVGTGGWELTVPMHGIAKMGEILGCRFGESGKNITQTKQKRQLIWGSFIVGDHKGIISSQERFLVYLYC